MPTPTSFNYQSDAAGKLTNAKTTLYTAVQEFVKTMTFYNAGAGNNTVTIYFKKGGTESRIFVITLEAGAHILVEDAGPFSVGDLIEGLATNTNEVEYWISAGVTA